MDLDEIWNIINTSEKNTQALYDAWKTACMIFELTTLYMAQQGLFGEILHGEGAYIHNLEDFWNHYEGDWRMEFNRNSRGCLRNARPGTFMPGFGYPPGHKMDILVAWIPNR